MNFVGTIVEETINKINKLKERKPESAPPPE